MENKKDLPIGWVWTTVDEITDLIRGVSYKKDEAREFSTQGLLPILRATNIQDESLILDSQLVYVPTSRIKDEQKLIPGDVVICISSGSKHLVGKAAQLHREWDGSFGTFCMAARLKPIVNLRFAGYFFGSPNYRGEIRKKSSGININNLRSEHIGSIAFPLPPLPVQERIVERIETLFTQLDAGVAGLKRAQAALKRYKASLLKAAVEGRLVPQDPNDEPAEELLKRILAERGQTFVAPQGDLGPLPNGWCWAKLSTITKWIVDVDHKMPKPALSTIPYISTRNFTRDDEIDYEKAKKISEEDFQKLCRKVKPEYNDILLSRYGTVGEVRKVNTHRDFQASYSIAIIKTLKNINFTDFLVNVIRSEFVQQQIKRDIRATAQPDLGLAHIRNFDIPFPPILEQNRIVAEIERRLSVVQELDQTIVANLKHANRLRQSILKRAFEGKLV